MSVRGALLAVALLGAGPAAAQAVSETPQSVAITIYRAGPADAEPNEVLADSRRLLETLHGGFAA